ncbi:MAG: hypothetical protein ABR577_09375 [Pyrinomonadaceae bacterium]
MKRLVRILFLMLLAALLLAQIPSLYKRYQFRKLRAAIAESKTQRAAQNTSDPYVDYKGVIHVHSLLGGHSTGSLADIIEAARANKLDFVLMTEHPAKDINTASLTLSGVHGGVLFIAGSEVNSATGDRLLIVGGSTDSAAAQDNAAPVQSLINDAENTGKLVFVTHPEQFRSWDEANGYDGMELYNMHAEGRKLSRLKLFFKGLWTFAAYADLLWMDSYQRPFDNLKRWDEVTAVKNRKVVAIAGNDAHANLGIILQQATGKRIFSLQLDPYERTFSIVRTHVLLDKGQPLDTETLTSALKRGHCYVSFDVLADATGFRFDADNKTEKKIMGDEIPLQDGVRLSVATPLPHSRIELLKNGQVIGEARNTSNAEFSVKETGVYRTEIYIETLPKPFDAKPWIISNPIYVR